MTTKLADREVIDYMLFRRYDLSKSAVNVAGATEVIELGMIPTDVWGFIEVINFASTLAGPAGTSCLAKDRVNPEANQLAYSDAERATLFPAAPGIIVAPGSSLFAHFTGLVAGDTAHCRLQIAWRFPVPVEQKFPSNRFDSVPIPVDEMPTLDPDDLPEILARQ